MVELCRGDGGGQVRDGLERFGTLSGGGVKRIPAVHIDDTGLRSMTKVNMAR